MREPKPPKNLRQFIDTLRREGEVVEIDHEVDPTLELAEIHRRIVAAEGPALLFKNVKGSSFPVVTNLFGTPKRVDAAFGRRPQELIEDLVNLATRDFPPKLGTLWQKRKSLGALTKLGTRQRRRVPVMEQMQAHTKLSALPLIKSWPEDGGHFLTLPLVYTEPVDGGPPNLGMYRMQRYDDSTMGLHWQIGKGGGFHHHRAEELGQALPVHVFLGGPPALMLSAISPLPENVPELLLCSLLQEGKLELGRSDATPLPLIGESEFTLVGEALPHTRRLEGPFGDHYGYYSLEHDFPVFQCTRVYHRKDAIYPATVVGKPRQEDFYLGDYLQKLLSPLFPVVMPGVKALWSYGETGFHSLSAAIVRERYYRESMASAFRILGEGQLSLTKFLLLTDQNVDVYNIKQVLPTVLERFRPETDLFVFANLSLDTLDYTGPELNKGSRGVMVGTGEKVRDLPTVYEGPLPQPATAAKAFCPGCLVVEVPAYEAFADFAHLLSDGSLQQWPLIVLVDDLSKATKNDASFLWTTFTRFEPAADIHAKTTRVHRHHICYSGSILIDARMKPSYPKELLCDEKTAEIVTKNWERYFPKGMAMGDSDTAHVC